MKVSLRELDALVAEHILGFVWWTGSDGKRILVAPEDVKHYEKYAPSAKGDEEVSELYERDCPHSSSDHNAAFEAVDKLFEDGWMFGLSDYRKERGEWNAEFYREQTDGSWRSEDGTTRPVAICKAALATKGIHVEVEE